MLDIQLLFKYGEKLAWFIRNKNYFWFLTKLVINFSLIKLKKFYWQFSIKGIKMDDLMQSVFCPNSPIAQKSFNEALHCFQRFANLHYTVQWYIFKYSTLTILILPWTGDVPGAFARCFFEEMKFVFSGFSFKWRLYLVLYMKAEMFS